MATQTTTTLVDDFDGTTGDAVIERKFVIDGTTYVIDLTDENAQPIIDVLAKVRQYGRKAAGAAAPAKRGKTAVSAAGKPSRAETEAARAWARASGIEVAERGRLSVKVWDQYQQAKNTAA